MVAALALGAAAGAFLWSQGLQPCDDAYITFRHARNVARHARPAWNLEGAPVLGSTSPVWVFVLGGLGGLFGIHRVDELALGVNAVVLAVVTVLAYLVARDVAGRPLPSLLGAALVGFSSVNVFILSLGFEGGLLVALLLGGLYCARTGRHLAAVLLASVAPLVRPEGILLSLLVWGIILLRRGLRAKLLVAYAIVPLSWLAFSLPYYGSPIPQSIRARSAAPSVFRPFEGGRVDLGERLLRLGPETARFAANEAFAYAFAAHQRLKDRQGGLPVAPLASLGLPVLVITYVRARDPRALYLLYAPLFVLLYAWIGWVEAWYFPSFVTFSVLTLFLGCVHTLDRLWTIAERRGWPAPAALRAASWAGAALLVFTANSYTLNRGREDKGPVYARDPRGPLFERAERERFNGYRRVAGIMNRFADPPRPALTSEVGVFGFFYRGEVIDTVGLCTPAALEFYPPPPADIWDAVGRPLSDSDNITPTAMVLTLKPAYVVNAAPYIQNLLQQDSPFLKHYSLVGTYGTAWSDPLFVFERRMAAGDR